MTIALTKRANGHDVVYYLGKNIEEANRISKIKDPIELASEIGEISAMLKAEKKVAKPKEKEPITKAPPPAATVSGKAKSTPADTSLTGKTQEERIKLLEEESRKRRLNGSWSKI